jgi:bifunctional DNA-binding transcriptional regulator/antitoxin component of YhaV-PrlF toxin-antitoxin module
MSSAADDRGRIYLPKDVRDRFGDRYRIVELPTHVALFPVDEDPLEGLQEAVGEAFDELEGDELAAIARRGIGEEVEAERTDRTEE